MKCDNAQRLMMDLLYDEIEDDKKQELMEHIDSCDKCRKEYAELSDTSEMLQSWPDAEPKVKMIFREEKKTGKKFKFDLPAFLRYPAVAAAVLLVALSLVNFQIRSSDGEFSISMSLFGRGAAAVSEQANFVTYEDLQKIQNENLLLTNQLIEERSREQSADNYQLINQLVKGLEQQRRNDMDAILTSFAHYQQNNNEQLYRTNRNMIELMEASTAIELKREDPGTKEY